ncbi:GrpB family protein [Brevibacillus sp. 179-C9.3 HS]|uniref:GrpB family protein n=1 Tax=unclassified Brevibacillus TaxID=2684853 RepID=UPI00399F2197
MRKMEVRPYEARWASVFRDEVLLLQRIFGDELVEIHHIGSTAVPGLSAKPIIDILPVVRDISRVDDYNSEMRAHGYEPRGELGLAGRRYFPKGGDKRTHHVHVYQVGHCAIHRHLAFRDYLRAHPDEAKQYGDVKQEMAKRFPCDSGGYVKGKEAFAKALEEKALIWKALGQIE